MQSYIFENLLFNDGWKSNVLIRTDEKGRISEVEENTSESADVIKGYTIPGFQNAHSHGFQYAMAGLAEIHDLGANPDDFWSWRDAMYRLALSISPDQMEVIATMLYSEMLRHGYTNVAEFHYVHHDKDGKQYSNLSEMGERMISAAKNVGINITLVPIFYQKGGFGKDPVEGQKRFISPDIDAYLRLIEASENSANLYDGANVGIGIHSMRGVEPKVIAEIAKSGPQDIPFHIHISEQLKEIEDSISYLGKRPVEWMLDNVEMNDRFHLVHATHLTDTETKGIADSGANVVICPTTEGNLGDGIFPLRDYQKYGGKWSIGTDSHVSLNPLEELRLLDYGQRLISHKRNTFTSATQGDSGLFGVDMALIAGRKSMNNFESDYFKVGEALNAVNYKGSPLMECSSSEKWMSTLVYSTDASHVCTTIVNGKKVVENGKHVQNNRWSSDFIETMKSLGSRI